MVLRAICSNSECGSESKNMEISPSEGFETREEQHYDTIGKYLVTIVLPVLNDV
jgi:hypothetical protein